MKKLFKVIVVVILVMIINITTYSQNWMVESYVRIEKKQTFLATWAKNTKELKGEYSLNTFLLVSDVFGQSKPSSQASVGIGKNYKNWYLESLIGFQQSKDGVDLMFKPSWGYSKNKLSVFNSWEFGFPSGSLWWTAHIDYKVYKDHYVGLMSRRKHGTGVKIGIVIKQFEFHVAQLWDTEVGSFKSVIGLKMKF